MEFHGKGGVKFVGATLFNIKYRVVDFPERIANLTKIVSESSVKLPLSSEKEVMSGKRKTLAINIISKHLSIKYSFMNNL